MSVQSNMPGGVTPTPGEIGAYTRAEVDTALAEKANADSSMQWRGELSQEQFEDNTYPLSYSAWIPSAITGVPVRDFLTVWYFSGGVSTHATQFLCQMNAPDRLYFRQFLGGPFGWGAFQQIATATPPTEYDLPLVEGWTAQQRSVYFKDQFGVVTVNIAIKATAIHSGGVTIGTLPEGHHPMGNVEAPVISKTPYAVGSVFLDSGGNLILWMENGIAANQMLFATLSFVAA